MTRRRDRGSATAELAVGLPALVLLVLAALSAVGAMLTQLACVDAAREAALVAARGGAGPAAAQRLAPDGATVSVSSDGSVVRATVTVRYHPLSSRLPGFDLTATSVAAVEPGPGSPP